MSSHMKGWETFNAVPSGAGPTSRPLGNDKPGTEEWPAEEVHGGVACIQISSYGDLPTGAYVHVRGPDQGAVEACFARTVAALQPLLGAAWAPVVHMAGGDDDRPEWRDA